MAAPTGSTVISANHSRNEGERLHKVMAAAGIASRRVSEQMIAEGRVQVNGRTVTELGARIDPRVDHVTADGVAAQLDPTRRYVMLNKPVGIVSSLRDERGRPDLTAFTHSFGERLFNVGRLDVETSGLLILTNDGALSHVLAHPTFGVTKTYVAKVRGRVSRRTLVRLRLGVELDDGPVVIDAARRIDTAHESTTHSLVELTLRSGRNRVVRRTLAAVDHPVVELVRREFGPLNLGSLRPGEMRALTTAEVGALLSISRQHNDSRERR